MSRPAVFCGITCALSRHRGAERRGHRQRAKPRWRRSARARG